MPWAPAQRQINFKVQEGRGGILTGYWQHMPPRPLPGSSRWRRLLRGRSISMRLSSSTFLVINVDRPDSYNETASDER